jgi:DNA-binding transcriptional ArsR family regulator
MTSRHLVISGKAGIVNAEKEEKRVYYSVNYRRLEELGEIAGRLLTF